MAAVGVGYYVGPVVDVAGVEADEVVVVVGVTAVVVAADEPQRPQYVVGVVADDGLVGVGAVVAVDERQWGKATDGPDAGPVT